MILKSPANAGDTGLIPGPGRDPTCHVATKPAQLTSVLQGHALMEAAIRHKYRVGPHSPQLGESLCTARPSAASSNGEAGASAALAACCGHGRE